MTAIATGSIVFWEGGSLWVFDVPERAAVTSRNATHSHHAIQITFALDGIFNLHLEGRTIPGPAAVIAPDVKHAFEACGQVALVFVEPESPAGRALSEELLKTSHLQYSAGSVSLKH